MTISAPPPEVELAAAPVGRSRAANLALGLAGACALLFVLALLDLIPAESPVPVQTVAYDVKRTVERARLPEQSQSQAPAHHLSLWSYPLCTRPREGARLYPLAATAYRERFVVWCQGEYVLLELDAQSEPPRLTRVGRFPARGERPGGVAELDLDRDGVRDMALGVAPTEGVVHRSFAGVYWLRGRPQGGYEPARALVEMPPAGLVAAELDGQPGEELVALTRGDPAAQRPGELWLFRGGVSPQRVALVPTALGPRELSLGATRGEQLELWVLATHPGALLRFRFARDPAGWAAPQRDELPLRGAQGFVTSARGPAPRYVRDALHVQAIVDGAVPTLAPWLNDVRVGPAALLDDQHPGRPLLLAAVADGFALVRGRDVRTRKLPEGVQVLDAAGFAALGQRRGALLAGTAEQSANLVLLVLPSDLRDEASEVELRAAPVEVSSSELRVALE